MQGRDTGPHITISAFSWVPEVARGRVKCLRPRWALEEAGLTYRTHLVGPGEGAHPDYRAWQPFGQVPAYRDDEVSLFESGAILLRIADLAPALDGQDAQGRADVRTWVFAALNSIEFAATTAQFAQDWGVAVPDWVGARFDALAKALDGRDWVAAGRFTVADIMLASVLRQPGAEGPVAARPVLAAYLDRGLARPAFARALAAQFADFVSEPA